MIERTRVTDVLSDTPLIWIRRGWYPHVPADHVAGLV